MTPITYLCKQTADFKKCSIESKYYNELTSPQTIGSTQYSLTKWFGNQVTGNRQPTKQVNGRSRSEKFSAIIIATAAIFWGRCHAMYVPNVPYRLGDQQKNIPLTLSFPM